MTTTIQAAIKALPSYDQMGTCRPIREFKNGTYLKRDDVLAALQAAPAVEGQTTPRRCDACGEMDFRHPYRNCDEPVYTTLQAAPGSIDPPIPTWQEREGAFGTVERTCHSGESLATAKAKDAEIADYRAHIAQRGASAYAPGVQQIVDAAHKYGTQDMRRQPCKDDFQFTPRQLVDFVRAFAAPVPIADEVADKCQHEPKKDRGGPNDDEVTRCSKCGKYLDAPKASAPAAVDMIKLIREAEHSAPAECPKCTGSGRSGKEFGPDDCETCEGEGVIAGAPAGDFPPLPEPFMELHRDLGSTVYNAWADQMRAYVLADRAARQSAPDTVRDLDRIGMQFAADLCKLPVAGASHARNVDYLARQDVMDVIVNWRAAWNNNSASRRAAVAPARHVEPVGEVVHHGFWMFNPCVDWEKIGDGTQLYAAPVAAEPAPNGPLYTCIGKGSKYELLGTAHGAGHTRKGRCVVYRDTRSRQLYYRIESDFKERMRPVGENDGPT